jgi:hypothetical protein
MSTTTRRLMALEAHEIARLGTLTDRARFDLLRPSFVALPTSERLELEAILEAVLDDTGRLDRFRVSSEMAVRGAELLRRLDEGTT